jgi:hypothetical protein
MTPIEAEEDIRQRLEVDIAGRNDRFLKSKVHPIIPHAYFSAASSQCRDMFVNGTFYGCITLAQSVAEGLARFVAQKSGLVWSGLSRADQHSSDGSHIAGDFDNAYAAFLELHGRPKEDRNHPSPDEATSRLRAVNLRRCIEALYDRS